MNSRGRTFEGEMSSELSNELNKELIEPRKYISTKCLNRYELAIRPCKQKGGSSSIIIYS